MRAFAPVPGAALVLAALQTALPAEAQPTPATPAGATDAASPGTAPAGNPEGTAPADGAAAGGAPAGATADPETARREAAKQLFLDGNALRGLGDFQGALEQYRRSLRVSPSLSATLNAGYCLNELGRYDEALELYERALTTFESALTKAEREQLGPLIRSLRAKVGSLEVSANVDGQLVIDGRDRGTLPLARPVRVLPGLRRVRVIKDGYATWEREVTVVEQDTTSLDARLDALAAVGQLVVDSPEAAGATLHVDGARVGTLPFSGRLAPGKHLYWLERGDEGTAPEVVTVVEGQRVRVAPQLAPLGPTLRITAQPPAAEVAIDRVPVGLGAWLGRLPVGPHVVTLSAEGYLRARRDVVVAELVAPDVSVELTPDPSHPRWGGGEPTGLEAATGRLALEVASRYRPLQGAGFDRVAVLPFREVGAAAKAKELGAVTAELVRTQLVSEHALPVTEQSATPLEEAVFARALSEGLAPEAATHLATELGAPGVVLGSVTEVGDSFVLHVRLVDLRSGAIVGSTYVKVRRADLIALADDAVVKKTRIGAVYHALAPGGGQFYNGHGHYWKGAVIGGGTLGGAAAATTFFLLASSQHQKALDLESSGTCVNGDPDDPCQPRIAAHLDNRDQYQRLGIGFAAAAAALYVYGIIDAALYGRDYEKIDLERTELRRGAPRRPRAAARSLGITPSAIGGQLDGGSAWVRVAF